jgi:FkbM family methyltransferase
MPEAAIGSDPRARRRRPELPDWISRLYFRLAIRMGIARHRNRVVHHDYGGFELAVSVEDPVGAQWYDHDWPMPPELAQLRESRLRPGARVFDLGAHQAVVALLLARLVEPGGEVIALEAEQHNYEVALHNRQLNDAGNLTVLHAAAAAAPGELTFTGGFNGNVVKSGGLGTARVSAECVDGLAARFGTPDVVFVDVEGFEHEVLAGARETIAAGKTDFFVEVHVGHGLEDLGGTGAAVLACFPPERYRLLGCRAAGELEGYEFAPIGEPADLLADRFFLLALPS